MISLHRWRLDEPTGTDGVDTAPDGKFFWSGKLTFGAALSPEGS
jgi:hypothetical protein